jgi:hypothetical protein
MPLVTNGGKVEDIAAQLETKKSLGEVAEVANDQQADKNQIAAGGEEAQFEDWGQSLQTPCQRDSVFAEGWGGPLQPSNGRGSGRQ